MSEKVEKALTDAGVFLGQDGLEKFANADAFWDEQPYGTRLYFGDGTTDYLQRGVLRAAIETLATIPDLRAALAKAEAERSAMRARLAPSVEYVDGLACGYGEDEIDRLDARLDSERARAERYLAAMEALMDTDVRSERRYGAMREVAALVEEARRAE